MLIKNVPTYNFSQRMVVLLPQHEYISDPFPQSGIVSANATRYGKDRTYIIRSNKLSGQVKRLCSSSSTVSCSDPHCLTPKELSPFESGFPNIWGGASDKPELEILSYLYS